MMISIFAYQMQRLNFRCASISIPALNSRSYLRYLKILKNKRMILLQNLIRLLKTKIKLLIPKKEKLKLIRMTFNSLNQKIILLKLKFNKKLKESNFLYLFSVKKIQMDKFGIVCSAQTLNQNQDMKILSGQVKQN